MRIPHPTTVDFETAGSYGRPDYPPEPAGVAIKEWGKKARYFAFAHASDNNCTVNQARQALRDAWRNPDGILCHSAKFDVDVAATHLGLPGLPWDRVHDTLPLLFLDDPQQRGLHLKESAKRLLGWEPEERDAVADWLVAHQPVDGVKISAAPKSDNTFMKYLPWAPGGLVGRYSIGDVERAEAIFKLLWPRIQANGMGEAYDRERRLMPVLLASERRGVPVDLRRLRKDVDYYTIIHNQLSDWIRRQLRAPELDVDSGQQLVRALLAAGKADEAELGVTENTGQPRSDKDALKRAVTDKRLAATLRYRSALGTCLQTFMRPWLEVAERSDGVIYTHWKQTPQDGGGGARTGRLSSSPNFQNIPNAFHALFREHAKLLHEVLKEKLPPAPFDNLPLLPKVRGYISPPKGWVLYGRDYSQQELRAMAHFEDGALKERYDQEPWLDVHDFAVKLISEKTGRQWERKPVKNTGFGLIYGMGIGALAEATGLPVPEAKQLKDAYLSTFPGLKALYADCKQRAAANRPIRTWGGRLYYCEPPKIIHGRIQKYDYKLPNVLIQGSSADCTKEAIIRHDGLAGDEEHLLLNVHDELLGMCPRAKLHEAMEHLREAMESVEFDVPMLSEGEWSDKNWAEMKTYDEKGKMTHGLRRYA